MIAGGVMAAVGIGTWFARGRGELTRFPDSSSLRSVPADRVPVAPRRDPAFSDPISRPPGGEAPGMDALEGETALDDEMAQAWSAVDLEEVRKAMPDNLYFKQSAPTKDPQVEAERDQERVRWNVEYGKVLSGTATDEEIQAYFDHRARLSSDYIEFTTHLLDHYGEQLPERDVALLELARRLHAARLEEIPRKVEEAFERKRQQDAARAAWLKDQVEFGAAVPESE
jgi:hypothetical protein